MDQIRDLFSSIAPKYDLLNTVLSFGVDRRWRQQAVQYLRGCRNVLDICAGTLALTRELLEIQPNLRITAIDFSKPMLELGIQKLPLAMRPHVTTECVDFYKLVRPAGSFDGAMSAYGLRNLSDNRAALEKINQLLSPKGRLVVLEFFRPDRWYTWAWHLTYAQFVIPLIGLVVSRHKKAYRHLRDSVRGFYTLDQYVQLLRETGFAVKVAERLTGGISGLVVAEKTSPPSPLLNSGEGCPKGGVRSVADKI